jgi:hypothetical protein
MHITALNHAGSWLLLFRRLSGRPLGQIKQLVSLTLRKFGEYQQYFSLTYLFGKEVCQMHL